MTDLGSFLQNVDLQSFPDELTPMLAPAILALSGRIRPVNDMNRAFLNTVVPVISQIPNPTVRRVIADVTRLGLRMEMIARDVISAIDAGLPREGGNLRMTAAKTQIWALLALEMAARTQDLRRILETGIVTT